MFLSSFLSFFVPGQPYSAPQGTMKERRSQVLPALRPATAFPVRSSGRTQGPGPRPSVEAEEALALDAGLRKPGWSHPTQVNPDFHPARERGPEANCTSQALGVVGPKAFERPLGPVGASPRGATRPQIH